MAEAIDDANRSFWNELCGTQLAQSIGVEDDTAQSLAKFDHWFFDFYPYLEEELPFDEVRDEDVLEVGLGYGSVSGRLMAGGCRLTALDIAAGPVAMAAHRAALLGVECNAVQASILEAPLPDASFDRVVGIGSYHHTGDTQRALDETLRLLRPGGTAYVMVYNAYSYRRWASDPGETWAHFKRDKFGSGRTSGGDERARRQYDVNAAGEAAPHTDFFSVSDFRRMTRNWSSLEFRRRNIGAEGPLRHLSRDTAMRLLGAPLGLDIYFRIRK